MAEVSIIMPALNEEQNIIATISNALKSCEELNIDSEIIVINDGSADKTEELVAEKIKSDNRIRMVKHDSPWGIGASFWDGVDNAKGKAVVLIPGDNENYSFEILRYYKLLEHVDIVIPFIFNNEVRSAFRNALSYIYRTIIDTTFTVNFNYTNGTVLYRKSILKDLDYRSSSFFFQTDILVRTVKKGYLFAEVPYRLGVRKGGASKALSLPSLIQVIKGYSRLIRDFYFKKEKEDKVPFVADSLTAQRRREDNVT